MTGPLDRAAAFFLTPPAQAPAAATIPTAIRAIVLGTRQDAPALAAALALTLRSADRAPTALVAIWRPEPSERDAASPTDESRARLRLADDSRSRPAGEPASWSADDPSSAAGDDTPSPVCAGAGCSSPARGAAAPGAARLAARLRRRDLPAAARGRLVWLDLPAEPHAAAPLVRRAAAAVDGPLVTALAGPRPPELDGLVEEHDTVVVAADPASPLARAALAGLPGTCLATACRPLRRGLPRAVALAGLATPRLEPPLALPRTERA